MSIFPHFRFYKKNNHPALIVGNAKIREHNDSYLYRKTSHSSKITKRGSEKVYPNPNPLDKRPMYIEKRKRVDFKYLFGPKLNWKYNKKK